ncbi:MAG TPA: ATPase, T2SS/T4P/T4SS family [Candidatus Saccharimonadales bacterium]|jgi:type IV pilus assembly protein PilB|nr:ATPase, T2SS/T4P/T4SS family [Candidatus Saccharimonadales bacterium]
MAPTDTELAQILGDLKYIPPQKLQAAVDQAQAEHTSLYDALVRHDYINDDELGKVMAYHYQLPYTSLDDVNITDTLLHLLPQAVAERFQTIPFQIDDDGLHIATTQPGATDLFSMLAKKAGVKKYLVSYTPEMGIKAALHLYKQHLQTVFNTLLASNQPALPINKIIDVLFEYAYDAHASDVHIEPQEDQTVVRFRINGVLHDQVTLPKKLHDQLITRLKIMARLRTDEHLGAQDGRLRTKISDEELSVRISVVPVIAGEKVVMRMLAKHARQFGLADLGMSPNDLDTLRHGFGRPSGMILSTGPTGSGKTTTIYAILKILNTRDRNIATIEDPIEYVLNGVNQIQANTKTNLTFSTGLRSLLRQDPDALFVGEIRDEETADIAINAAMTGHLVLSTMHTNDAVTTLPRLVDMHIEPFLAASTVNLIVGQRLVRQICDHCKASIELTRTAKGWKGDATQAGLLTNLDPALITKYFGKKTSVRLYHGTGCSSCSNTGYQERIGIFELLEITPKMAQLITAKADAEMLQARAVKDGMITMLEDGLSKVISGKTTLAEVVRVTGG